jgi:hypothetical protein
MKLPIAIAVAWTALFLAVLLFVGGGAAPCPELAPVGLPGTDREAIARMCAERYRATRDVIGANESWSWLVIWGLGVGAIAVAVAGSRRRAAAT